MVVRVSTSADDNGNGTLEAAEVDTTAVICNGAKGATGAGGANGATGATGANGANGATGAIAPAGP